MILGDVIARLVVLFDGAVTSTVFDGPIPEAVNHGRYVLVGSDGENDDGASAELEPSDLGPGTWWDERGEVTCSAWSHHGGADLAARRSEALADAEACLAAVHDDRSLGGLLITPGATTSGVFVSARQTTAGALVRVTFTVAYQALNT